MSVVAYAQATKPTMPMKAYRHAPSHWRHEGAQRRQPVRPGLG